METTLTINIPAPSARTRGAGVEGAGGVVGGGDKEEKIKTHSEKNISYKDKFHKTREKYDKVTAAHETYQKNLEIANAILKNLQAENELLLDAMFVADSGLYDRYFSTVPGSLSSPLDPPESDFVPPIPPPPPSSSQAHYPSQYARYPPPPPPLPPHSNPYPHPSHPSAVQTIAGPSSSSHHPQHPHHRDHNQHHHHPHHHPHQHQHHHISKKRRSDAGPSPPEESGLISVSPSASTSNNANPSSSIPAAVDFDPQYDNVYRRSSRSSGSLHGHPSHLNGNSNGGVGASGHGENGIGHGRSLEHVMDEDEDTKPEVVNGRS